MSLKFSDGFISDILFANIKETRSETARIIMKYSIIEVNGMLIGIETTILFNPEPAV